MDTATIRVTHAPPPPPERPSIQLRKAHTAPELRRQLADAGLSTTGTKIDMSLRLARRTSFVDIADIRRDFTKSELLQRLRSANSKLSKEELSRMYLEVL